MLLNEAPPLLGHRALHGRKLVMRNRDVSVPYFVKTLARSNDEAHWRERHDQARRQRLQEGRFGRP